MNDKLLKLLNKLEISEEKRMYFNNGSLKKILCNDETNVCCFFIDIDSILPVDIYSEFMDKLVTSFISYNKVACSFNAKNVNLSLINNYYQYFMTYYGKDHPMLEIFSDNDVYLNDNIFTIEVDNSAEVTRLKTVKNDLIKDFKFAGFGDIKINFKINEENRKKIQEQISKKLEIDLSMIPKTTIVEEKKTEPKWKGKTGEFTKKPPEEGCILGKNIDTDVSKIFDIQGEEDTKTIEAKVFGIETIETKSGLKITTMKLTDYTDSICAKLFSRTEEEFKNISTIKLGMWLKLRGYAKNDTFAHELVFMPRDIKQIFKEEPKRLDLSKDKRIELHSHTKMSQMDGVADEVKLVHQAMDWGHPGIAITDHDCCQAFPHVFTEVTSFNKANKKAAQTKIDDITAKINEYKENNQDITELEQQLKDAEEAKKNLKPFKAGYGTELNMCESYLNVCFNATDELLEHNTFVVFDTETTGFNPGLGDSMIEIGGVKIQNGEVIERFDELINPGHHIDEAITLVTDISDDDVKDADNEEEVIKRFKEWIGILPLVAHNARFDKNMLDMAYYKYKLGKLENPIIDTLMLSRVINRDQKKHSLKALGKLYGVDTGESDDDDNSEDASSTDLKIDDYVAPKIKDILVDDESLLKKREDGIYLLRSHKASKTEEVKIKYISADGEEIENLVKLHPADNTFDIPIDSIDTITVTIYVGQHHGADVDAENTAYIFNKMLKQIDGITKISQLNDLGLLEDIVFTNDQKKREHIGDLCSYKIYIRQLGEEEVPNSKFGFPFEKYGNKNYVWKYEWCHDNWLQMYENIPGKTFTENFANIYDSMKHVTFIAKNKVGLKNLFKIVSFANSNFLQSNATIPRKIIEEYREGVLVGSACLNGEIFYLAETRSDDDLIEAMKFYDYIEVQPIDNYAHLIRRHDVDNYEQLEELVKKIIRCAKKAGKLVVATGDVHQINPEDRLYREIIVNQNVPGKGRHPLARCLNGDPKICVNLENLDRVVRENKDNLEYIDIKVLKYIYVLTNIQTIPLTLENISFIYQVEKNGKDEMLKGKDEEKKAAIENSLHKLIVDGIIGQYHVVDDTVYEFKEGFKNFKSSPLAEGNHIPNQYFRTTDEMNSEFLFLENQDLIHEIVIDNPQKILDQIEIIEVVVYPDKPFSPIIPHSQETCRDLVFNKAHSMYGDPLPRMIEERIAQEFYGDKILGLVDEKIRIDHPEYKEEEVQNNYSNVLHSVIMSGYDGVVNLMKEKLMREDNTLTDEYGTENAKAVLGGIIGGGFDVIYLIAQKLVKHSNDDGYLVGSRGSVGSSFVASMMGITECNGLPPHYYCPQCQYSMFEDEKGVKYTETFSSGFDLPERDCPKCGAHMIHQGNDMPFATFLGFNADKVPDIDLNFSGDNQASAHEYTKVLFGTDNVYRAGTISTVADKTAYGYVLGFFEEQLYNALRLEAKSYGIDVTGKDELKKKGVIKCTKRVPEVERIAIGCTDVKRTTGQHPGGIVVVPGYRDVWDFTPFQYPADDPTAAWRTTHFDYHAIDADLLKLDILGHDDPTVLRMLQELSGIDVTSIDLGDLDTMKIFTGPEVLGVKKDRLRGLTAKDGHKYCPTGTLGVPEFGTPFLLGMLEETKPTTFAELIKISGLSHGTDVWLGNARDLCTPDENGNIKVPFKQVIGCRDDIMVNLMQWGMKPSKAFKIMEFVRKGRPSKAKKNDDPQTWIEYKQEMHDAGIPQWYIDSCQKIKYMFPKAHATAYVTSAFRIAWFKVHMPIFYYAAYFSIRCDQFDVTTMIKGEDAIRSKIDELEEKKNNKKTSPKEEAICDVLYVCLEMCARGFHFENISIEKSNAKKFKVSDDKMGLIVPFSALDGLGDNVALTIIKERKKSPFISIEDLQLRGKVSQKLIEQLRIMGALDGMDESNQLSLF